MNVQQFVGSGFVQISFIVIVAVHCLHAADYDPLCCNFADSGERQNILRGKIETLD